MFRHKRLKHFHVDLGHFGIQRLFLTLSYRVYWKNLFKDIHEFCHTCDTCLRSKRNFGFRSSPLNPLPVPNGPCESYSLDHKVLSRPTKRGNVAVLCIVDQFSGWPILRGVPDLTAYATARVAFTEVIVPYGVPFLFVTDKGSSYCGSFFSTFNKIFEYHSPY